MIYTNIEPRIKTLLVGAVIALFAFTSIFVNFPVNFAHAETLSGIQVTADPSTGTVNPEDIVIVRLQTPGYGDLTIDPAGSCTINGKAAGATFQNFMDGSYQLTYTVAEGDASAAAGTLSINCAFVNGAGDTGSITAFTDSNTLAVNGTATTGGDTGGDTGGTGTTTDTTDGSITNSTVSAMPNTGNLTVGQTVEVHIQQLANKEDITVNGACTVNNVAVNNFENLHSGHYKITYTVTDHDQNVVSPNQIPLSCALTNSTGQTATIIAFTDNNTVTVTAHAGGTGTTTDTGGNTGGTGTTTATTTDGTINGDVSGGTTGTENGVLAVTGIEQVKSVAVADGTLENGWKWVFHITVPSNEAQLQLKFANWMHSNGTNSISPANNMRVSPAQAGSTNILVTEAGTYTLPMTVTSDLNGSMAGKQVDVTVEMGVPVGSVNGSYSTTYHVKSSQP